MQPMRELTRRLAQETLLCLQDETHEEAHVLSMYIVCVPRRCTGRSAGSYQHQDQAAKSNNIFHCGYCKSAANRLAKRFQA